MSISIFLSGVSAEFREQRQQLAWDLGRLRNLGVSPVVQENLADKVTNRASLVEKLVSNVQSCELAICMIGLKAGYPDNRVERLEVLELAKRHLQSEYGKSGNHLGELWIEWEALELGMTYTQLEFFLAASVFCNDIRVRVYRHDWKLVQDDHSSIDHDFLAFLAFLDNRSNRLDWTVLTHVATDALCLAAEFAFLRRDSEDGIGPTAQSHEAIERGIMILEDCLQRKELTNTNYQQFYQRCVLPRLFEKLISLEASSKHSISGQILAVFTLRIDGFVLVLIRLRNSVQVLFVHEDTCNAPEQILFTSIGDEEQVYGFDPVSRTLLTFDCNRGYVLRVFKSVWEISEVLCDPQGYAPDSFSTTLGIVGKEGNSLWFAVKQNQTWCRFRFGADEKWIADSFDGSSHHTLESVVIQQAPFRIDPKNKNSLRLMMDLPWGRLTDCIILVVDQTGHEAYLQLRRFRVVPTASLFLDEQSNWLDGPFFDEVTIDLENGCTVARMRTNTRSYEFSMSGVEQSAIKLVLRTDKENSYVPKDFKYALSDKGNRFIFTESDSEDLIRSRTEKTRITCMTFPMPSRIDAKQFLKQLQEMCRGSRRIHKLLIQ